MKDSEFMELLNLYIDQQIEPADATRLEEEIVRSPARRRTYLEYCRMHRACVIWSGQAASVETEPVVFEETVAHRVSAWSAYSWVGGLAAAAALVALVYVNRATTVAHQAEATKGDQLVQFADQVVPAPGPVQPVEYKFVIDSSRGVRVPETPSSFGAAAVVPDRLNWLANFQIAPLARVAPEKLAAEVLMGKQGDQNVFKSPSPVEAPATEASAFQFQK